MMYRLAGAPNRGPPASPRASGKDYADRSIDQESRARRLSYGVAASDIGSGCR